LLFIFSAILFGLRANAIGTDAGSDCTRCSPNVGRLVHAITALGPLSPATLSKEAVGRAFQPEVLVWRTYDATPAQLTFGGFVTDSDTGYSINLAYRDKTMSSMNISIWNPKRNSSEVDLDSCLNEAVLKSALISSGWRLAGSGAVFPAGAINGRWPWVDQFSNAQRLITVRFFSPTKDGGEGCVESVDMTVFFG